MVIDKFLILYHLKLSGTPATCVNIALNHIYKGIDFDLVIGGPNFGRNITT
jgi:5'/3'-nucleotidase SurE